MGMKAGVDPTGAIRVTTEQQERYNSLPVLIAVAIVIVASVVLGFVYEAWWLFAVAAALTTVLAVEWGEAGSDTD